MSSHPRVIAVAVADPPYCYTQDEMFARWRDHVLGPDWPADAAATRSARQFEHLFAASRVEQRRFAVDLPAFYARPRTTAERMREYARVAPGLGKRALNMCFERSDLRTPADLTDLVTVSCTGYVAPGLDIQLASALGVPRDVRRVAVGHMGCYGAIVGMRLCLASVRAYPDATAALVSVELSSLHFTPSLSTGTMTSTVLFGDAAAALVLGYAEEAVGPELVDVYCAAEFSTADQMTWTISDSGFEMELSPRVPVTLRRNIAGVVGRLLDAHGLRTSDITHWLVHPGGPSILDVIQKKLELSDEQVALSWEILRDRGNCSSTTVLLILDALMRSGRTQSGEWAVVMAFGPGLTLETCLLRF